MGSAWEGETEATLLLEDAAVAEEGAGVGRKSHAGHVHGHATVLADQETLVLLALADRAAAATTVAAPRSTLAPASATAARNSRSAARAPPSRLPVQSPSHPLRNAHQLGARVLLKPHQQ